MSFSFPEPGSRVLREWNERRSIERAIAQRHRIPRAGGRTFTAAAIDRLTASMAQWSGSVNSDLDAALTIMRSRARGLCANNEFGRRFLSLASGNIVGPSGPTLQVRALTTSGALDKAANDAIETHYARWANVSDATGRMTLARQLQVVIKGVARDGEALVRKVRDKSLPYGLQIQLLEPDRLDEGLNARLAGGKMIRQGVELDSLGRPVAYHLASVHPGENYATGAKQIERVLARDLYHIFLPERAEQVRGYTWLHAVLIRAQMLHGYEEAAVVAARVGASKMGIWTKNEDADPNGLTQVADAKDASGHLQMSAEPGDFIEAPLGYKLESWDPDYPHENFESFLKACIRGLSVGLDVANHNLSGDMTGVNYSSARIAELTERDAWKLLQEWFSASFLVPLFRDWLLSALFYKQITFAQTGNVLPVEKFPKFADAAHFQARRWDWVDPKSDAEASEKLIAARLTSRTAIAAAQGREIEDIFDELEQEEKQMKARGLTPAEPKAAQPVDEPNSDPKPKGEDEEAA